MERQFLPDTGHHKLEGIMPAKKKIRVDPGLPSRRRFSELSEAEVLALAISSEEDDARIYATYAEQLREEYPATSAMFNEMAAEEDGHRKLLIDSLEQRAPGSRASFARLALFSSTRNSFARAASPATSATIPSAAG
jgi:rubrerythrin